ncbi:MAG: right-handed parallel beta-helix repeat-containing protein [Candidatus Promineofilum sp.]|nr:right-handed parallel beta-helix repeat-containing protein [Promineifilum sp.]
MKVLNRRAILWLSVFSSVVLLLTGLRGVNAERSRNNDLDPGSCDVVVGPGDSIQNAINANYLTICVRGGIYQEAILILGNQPGRTLIAYGDGTPIIDGNKRLPGGLPSQQYKALVELQGAGTVVDGFEIRFSSGRGLDVAANNITIRNSSIHDNWTTGIVVRGNAQLNNILIENNQIYNNLLKAKYVPVIYRGERDGSGPTGWSFNPDVLWDSPFWSGKEADLPESSLNGLALTFNTDGTTARIYAGSIKADKSGTIGADFSVTGQSFTYNGQDILFHDPAVNKWTLYFDGSALALPAGAVVDAFQIESAPPESLPCAGCAPILMSFAGQTTVSIEGVATAIGAGDLVRFSPSAVDSWDRITGGGFSFYKSAAEMGLSTNTNIDALDRAPDGRLLISTAADGTIGFLSIDREDLAAFDETSATWSLYFDGDQIPFNPFTDDLTAAWLDSSGHIYVSGDPIGGSALAFIETTNATARGNRIYNNYGEGLVAGRVSENVVLENNVVYDNYHANLYLNSTTNPIVRSNLVYCTDDPAFMRKGASVFYTTAPGIQVRDESFLPLETPPPLSSGQLIINNIVIGCSNNFGVSTQRGGGGLNGALVANNTFANARGESANGVNNIQFDDGASYAGSRFINNLILQNTPGAILRVQGANANFTTFTVAHNLYSVAPPASWFAGEPGRVIGNPQLAHPAPPPPAKNTAPDPDQYRLTYTSPALDGGQALAELLDDFFAQPRSMSGPPDIGIHELPHIGRIIVAQTTLPAGASQTFDYTASFAPTTFTLSAGLQQESGFLEAGVYSITAGSVDGWTTTATCSDGSSPDAIVLAADETITCTFSSSRRPRLIVTNAVEPGDDPQSFDFTLDPGGAFSMAGGDSQTFDVEPGAYSVTATAPTGWEQAAVCDNDDAPHALTLAVGDSVTCSFTHRKMGRITVLKQTDPPDTPGTFSFTTTYGNFSLSHGQSHDSGYLSPGATHSVTEAPMPGWALSTATCAGDDDGNDPAHIVLDPGEAVTCTFVNGRTTSGPVATFYLTTVKAGSARSLAYSPGDILRYDNFINAWSVYFDASDVGITKALSDFVILEDGSLLLVFKARVKLSAQTGATFTVDPQDIARFVPSQIGATTAGYFEPYFDGSDVALSTSGEKIDALAVRPGGTLLISTSGAATVKNGNQSIKAADEDLLAFAPTNLGATTAGVWQPLFFDGSTLAGMAVENVTSAWYDGATMTVYLTVMNNFNVKGVAGTNQTVLAVAPGGAVSAYWNSAAADYPVPIDGLHIQK